MSTVQHFEMVAIAILSPPIITLQIYHQGIEAHIGFTPSIESNSFCSAVSRVAILTIFPFIVSPPILICCRD